MAKINLSGISTGSIPLPPAWPLSKQQKQIINHIKQPAPTNLIIEARAGTGKTSILIEICKHLEESAILLSYNKAIATELSQRLATQSITQVKAATFHSVGFQAWVRMPGAARKVDGKKIDILMEILSTPKKYRAAVKKAVSIAKQALVGAIPQLPADDADVWLVIFEHFDIMDMVKQDEDGYDEDVLDLILSWCLKILKESTARADKTIDFDDMLYLPIYHDLKLAQYSWVMIDEAQDTNQARRIYAQRMLSSGGTLVAVGDRHQAIYGFTGADSDALDLIKHDFNCDHLPLTISYRCPKAVIEFAQYWVPDIEAAPDAQEGTRSAINMRQFSLIVPDPSDAILCRNLKPLVPVAFDYLRRHIPCHIEGRDIGVGLIALCRKYSYDGTVGDLTRNLMGYLSEMRIKLSDTRKFHKLEQIEDRVFTITALSENFDDSAPARSVIELISSMFQDSDGFAKQTTTLSTIHKAKGREWDRVFLLGRNLYMPSKYATLEWQIEQESNLAYVAITRAKRDFIDVELK